MRTSLPQQLALQNLRHNFPTQKITTKDGDKIVAIKLSHFGLRYSRDKGSPRSIRDDNYFERYYEFQRENHLTFFPLTLRENFYSDQEYVSVERIEHYINKPSHPLPSLLYIDDNRLIIEGHHRIIAKKLVGFFSDVNKMRGLVTYMRRI